MGTAKESNQKYLQNKIQEIVKILGEMQEAAEDTHTEHRFHDVVGFFKDWNNELKPRALPCPNCTSLEWRQEQIVKLESPSTDLGKGLRSYLTSRLRYVCINCGTRL